MAQPLVKKDDDRDDEGFSLSQFDLISFIFSLIHLHLLFSRFPDPCFVSNSRFCSSYIIQLISIRCWICNVIRFFIVELIVYLIQGSVFVLHKLRHDCQQIVIVANCEFSVVKIDFDSILILLHNSQFRSLNEKFLSSDELIVYGSFSFVSIASRL